MDRAAFVENEIEKDCDKAKREGKWSNTGKFHVERPLSIFRGINKAVFDRNFDRIFGRK